MVTLFTSVAGLIHIYIFAMESLLWGKPRTNKAFGINATTAEQNRLFAFNQGYYNLFLALSAIAGAVLIHTENKTVGQTLIGYTLGSMFGASVVLYSSNKKLWRPAMIQGLPPLLGLLSLAAQYFV